MSLYYLLHSGSQESCADFAVKATQEGNCQNECFATNCAAQNHAEAPMPQGVPAPHGDEGLVYANNHTNTSYPVYLTLAADELRRYEAYQEEHRPRGRHAKVSIKASREAHKKTVAWQRLPSDDRERRILDYAFRSESIAFTLNLTPKKQAQLAKDERPAKALADAINRRCKTLLGRAVPISLALEISPTGRLHVHGIATLEHREWKSFRDALKSAGGKVEGYGAGRQTDTRRLWSATGWAAYMAKAFHETAEALGTDKIFYQCNATRAAAREEYEASLHRQKACRKTQRRPRNAK